MKVRFIALSLILLPCGLWADEEERRAFFDPENRAQKYQRPCEIFPSRMARAGNEIWALPPSPHAGNFSVRYEFAGKTLGIDDFMDRTQGNALLILKDGRIVYETYRNGSGPSTKFISFSTGKSVTSTLVGIAVEKGMIDALQDDLTTYLPALTGSAYEGVTIRDALQMVSGVEWDESGYDFSDRSRPLIRTWHESYVEHRYRMIEAVNEWQSFSSRNCGRLPGWNSMRAGCSTARKASGARWPAVDCAPHCVILDALA
jgi:hypothetical protein